MARPADDPHHRAKPVVDCKSQAYQADLFYNESTFFANNKIQLLKDVKCFHFQMKRF